MSRSGKKPEEFPYESFVEKSVEKYLQNKDFELKDASKGPLRYVDIRAERGEDEWRIECKGKTSAIKTDFNTGLGQILEKMDDENSDYAIALPDISPFKKQTRKIPDRVQEKLNLSWIWVEENGKITIETPPQ